MYTNNSCNDTKFVWIDNVHNIIITKYAMSVNTHTFYAAEKNAKQ